jgi:pyrroloquinoline quinone (PQQ) biosynthesis protein C
MEHMTNPYDPALIESAQIQKRIAYITSVEQEMLSHRFLDHEFFIKLRDGFFTPEFVAFFTAQYSKHIAVFTKALSNLLGATNDLESRYMLFDNLYEEMGMGVFEECHYRLYCDMMSSMGLAPDFAASLPQMDSIEVLNDALLNATNDVVSGLTWLGIGGEQTIPNHFPCMRKSVADAYADKDLDWRFFDRHGERDEMHADDAKMVLACNMKDGDEHKIVSEATKCLHARAVVCEEFMQIARANPTKYIRSAA